MKSTSQCNSLTIMQHPAVSAEIVSFLASENSVIFLHFPYFPLNKISISQEPCICSHVRLNGIFTSELNRGASVNFHCLTARTAASTNVFSSDCPLPPPRATGKVKEDISSLWLKFSSPSFSYFSSRFKIFYSYSYVFT